MVAFGHTAVGASIGAITYLNYIDRPVEGLAVALGAGIVSHYVADFIPHGHFVKKLTSVNTFWILLFDVFLSVFLFLFVSLNRSENLLRVAFILFGIGGSLLPDILDGLMRKKVLKVKGLLKVEYNFHQALHWHGSNEKSLSIGWYDVWQITVIIISLYLVMNLK